MFVCMGVSMCMCISMYIYVSMYEHVCVQVCVLRCNDSMQYSANVRSSPVQILEPECNGNLCSAHRAVDCWFLWSHNS